MHIFIHLLCSMYVCMYVCMTSVLHTHTWHLLSNITCHNLVLHYVGGKYRYMYRKAHKGCRLNEMYKLILKL